MTRRSKAMGMNEKEAHASSWICPRPISPTWLSRISSIVKGLIFRFVVGITKCDLRIALCFTLSVGRFQVFEDGILVGIPVFKLSGDNPIQSLSLPSTAAIKPKCRTEDNPRMARPDTVYKLAMSPIKKGSHCSHIGLYNIRRLLVNHSLPDCTMPIWQERTASTYEFF